MARIESSEESESRSEGAVRYGSDEGVESGDTSSRADSGASVHDAGERKEKGVVISGGSSVVKGKGEALKKGGRRSTGKQLQSVPAGGKKGERGSAGKQLQSVPVGGYPSKASIDRINRMNFPRGVEWRVPLKTERAWTPPAGFMCLYESYFEKANLFFPVPRAIIEFCARKRIAISQLGTVTMIDLLGLIVFGAELGITVDASFLERRVRLISNTKSAGTFQTQAGAVKDKPSKISGWNWNYFYVKINEASVGRAGSSIISAWNQTLGGKGHEDCCVKDSGEPYSSNLMRIEQKLDRGYALFTRERVYRQRSKICEQSGYVVCRSSVGRVGNDPSSEVVAHPSKNLDGGMNEGSSSSAGRPRAVVESVEGNVGEETQVIEVEDDQGDGDSDQMPLMNKRAKVDAVRKEKARTEEPEMAAEAVEASKKGREAALAVVELGAKKRKEREEKKKGKGVEVAGKGDGRGSGSSTPMSKKLRTGGSLVIPGSASIMSKREGKKAQIGENRSHRFKFDYQGETPVMMDPRI